MVIDSQEGAVWTLPQDIMWWFTCHYMKIVPDTHVVLAAAYSRRGASSRLLGMLADGAYEIALTLPLFPEYRDVLLRDSTMTLGVDRSVATELCEDLAAVAHGQTVYFLWRPWLRDPNDNLVLEAAVASGAKHIVTHNVRMKLLFLLDICRKMASGESLMMR